MGRIRIFTAKFSALTVHSFRETLAESISSLLLLSSAAVIHIAPAFQFHRFGEPGRMARDGGLSAIILIGTVFAAGAAARRIGRESTDGPAAAALARPVPRPLYLLGKCTGVLATLAAFALTILAATALSALSCEIAAGASENKMVKIATVDGICLALGAGGLVLALAGAAACHRFFKRRFSVSLFVLTAISQMCACAIASSTLEQPSAVFSEILRLGGPVVLAFCYPAVFIFISSMLSVRLKPAAAGGITAFIALTSVFMGLLPENAVAVLRCAIPDLRCFWAAGALSNGGSLPLNAFLAGICPALTLSFAWFAAGALLLDSKDIG